MGDYNLSTLPKDVYTIILKLYGKGLFVLSMTSKIFQHLLATYFSRDEYLQFIGDYGVENGLPKMIEFAIGLDNINPIVAIAQKYLDGKMWGVLQRMFVYY